MNLPAMFLDLLNASISATWLVLGILLLRLLLKKAPKWLTCALWALVAIRLVMPFSIESIFSLIPSTQTLPPEILTENRFEVNTGIPVINQHINHDVLGSYYEGVTVPVDTGLNMVSEASQIWLIGMVILALYSLCSYLFLRRKVAASIPLRENIYLCDYIDTPFILGLFRPRIYLPSSLEATSQPHVLAHEHAHLKRRDHWWKPLGFALLCIHWFNPLMWLAYVLLCKDIELACDEKVIKELGTQDKAAYSQALLECSMPRYLIAACPLAFGEVGVKERVKSILNYKKPAFWVIVTALILCITAAVCFLTDPVTGENVEFIGTVIGTYQTYIAVEPHPDSNEAKSSKQIHVTLPENTPAIQNGDTVRIVYDGSILESSPAQITSATKIEVLTDLKYVTENYSLTRAILANYVVMIDGDVVANPERMHNFYQKVGKGAPASIRFVTYFTIGDPDRMSDELFESSRAKYPSIYFHELSYDGNKFTLRWFEGETEYVQTWKYLLRFEGKPANPSASFMGFDSYMLTNRNDVTYEMLWNGVLSSNSRDHIPFTEVYHDDLYDNEPTLAELEAAKLELEPYMVRYRIASIDANELTDRLDIQVYEWVDGLFDIIEQHIDQHFVTVTELRHNIAFTGTSYNRVEDAIQDGCFALINGNPVAGQEQWTSFLHQVSQHQPATLRLVNYLTLSSNRNYDPGDFPDVFRRYPVMSVSDLVFDGKYFTQYRYSDGLTYRQTYRHLLRYADVTDSVRTYRECYVLTDHEDLTWEQYLFGSSVSYTKYPRGSWLWGEKLGPEKPSLTELDRVRTALMPHMQAYQITEIQVNSLTNRLDITSAEWVEGLDALISQYIDLNFVTIVHEDGLAHLEKQNDLTARFRDYFGLEYSRGLDLYALTDGGYVLASRVDPQKTDAELQSMPKATAAEMEQILQSYRALFPDYHIINRTNRTEYEILKELGIYPECSVNANLSNVTAEGATITFDIYNLDDKEVWAGQEFQLAVMTDDGWVNYGYDPAELTWDTSLQFHRQGTGMNPHQTSFLTRESVECTVSWSAVGETPLPPGQYRYYTIIYIRDGDEIRGHGCWALFNIP